MLAWLTACVASVGMAATVEFRGTHRDALHGIVAAGWTALRAALAAADRHLPRFVTREVEGYLGCGDFARGFAWLNCADCDTHRMVPFSCKGRGFCPACGGRRMADTAAHWLDRVLPRAPYRQWVLTVPWPRRRLLARNPHLASGVLRIAMDEVRRFYREAVGRPDGEGGSVTAQQRFGSALQLNLHFHALTLDGVYVRAPDGRLSFRKAAPRTEDVGRIVARIAERAEAFLAREGFPAAEAPEEDDDDTLALFHAASLQRKQAMGPRAGRTVRTTQVLGGREVALPPLCAAVDGYNLHAGVAVRASERDLLERVCRYLLRPPLAKGRLTQREDGTVELRMRRAFYDGTVSLLFAPMEFVEKLCAIVPPPRANTVSYAGVFGGNHRWRREVIPPPPRTPRDRRPLSRGPTKRATNPDRSTWAELLKRVFGKDGWACEVCAKPMTLRALVVNPPATTRIVRGLHVATGPPTP